MPTNFTVVPVEARADGGQDEAAEAAEATEGTEGTEETEGTEAPGPPEGEPDCQSPGERGRTCPPDKGGAGLRGARGRPGGGAAPEPRRGLEEEDAGTLPRGRLLSTPSPLPLPSGVPPTVPLPPHHVYLPGHPS